MGRLRTGAAVEFSTSGRYSTTSGKFPTVIVIPSWGESIEGSTYLSMAGYYCSFNFHCVLVALRGHEHAKGSLSTVKLEDHVEDIHAVIEYLNERPETDKAQLLAWANGYGAYLLACMAPKLTGVKAMTLHAPQLRYEPAPTGAACALQGVREYKGKLRLSVGEHDDNKALLEYSQAAGLTDDDINIVMGAGGGKLDPFQRADCLQDTIKFFLQHYPASPAVYA